MSVELQSEWCAHTLYQTTAKPISLQRTERLKIWELISSLQHFFNYRPKTTYNENTFYFVIMWVEALLWQHVPWKRKRRLTESEVYRPTNFFVTDNCDNIYSDHRWLSCCGHINLIVSHALAPKHIDNLHTLFSTVLFVCHQVWTSNGVCGCWKVRQCHVLQKAYVAKNWSAWPLCLHRLAIHRRRPRSPGMLQLLWRQTSQTIVQLWVNITIPQGTWLPQRNGQSCEARALTHLLLSSARPASRMTVETMALPCI